MDALLNNAVFIGKGLWMTVALALVTLFFSTVISLVLGVLATLRSRLLRAVIHAYVEFFRAIPLIVNIFFVYFALPLFGVQLSPFTAVCFGLTLWGSANGIEIVRGGLQAVPAHQWRSAWALGLRPWEIYWFVAGPQALKAIVPPFTGLLTLLVQATSLGALVGVTEFLKVGQIIVERSTIMGGQSPAFVVYAFVLLVYFLICSALTWLSRYLERRLNKERAAPRVETPTALREST
ncbi:amino acid ABC transporter permease [Orrella sp. JC864]|uniref:amino acid ABC transporter permease n=1 Tax=Orrella sp. JC864 TaxID=3120298 RepID=UPI0012BB7826